MSWYEDDVDDDEDAGDGTGESSTDGGGLGDKLAGEGVGQSSLAKFSLIMVMQ